MKLTKEEIRFIDRYLLNNDVVYVDIRQEILDHIATAVEQRMETFNLTFYDAFKSYMNLHKREIMKENKNHGTFSLEVMKQFLFFLLKPYMLVLAVLLFWLFSNVDVPSAFPREFTFNNLFYFLVLGFSLFQWYYFRVYLKKRFYSIEKTSPILVLIYFSQIFFLPILGKANASALTITIFVFLLFAYVVYFINEVAKFHKHQFNYI